MSTNGNELNYAKNADSGLSELRIKQQSFQELAEDVYNQTNLIMNASDLFSEIATTPYGMRLKELAYRLKTIAYGHVDNGLLNDATATRINKLYSLEDINFFKAISLCEKLIDVIGAYDDSTTLDNDVLTGEFADFKDAIDKAVDLDIKTYEEHKASMIAAAIATAKVRGEKLTEYYKRLNVEDEENSDPVVTNGGENTENPDKGQFPPVTNPKEETKADTTATSKTDTGKKDTTKTDTSKSDTKPSTDKTEPSKDTDTKTPDTKEPDKTIENKPQPDSPTTITDNKGSSGVSHGTSSSSSNSNGNGNYTFTNSGISASQDEPIESLTDENPTEGSNTTLPVDEEDVYTIPTDLSGVTSKTKNSSGGSGVLPVIGGLGAAAAVGVGAKIYMDNKKNNDNGEDLDETDEISDTDEWNETTDGNDGILADEWNEDDSNFEFEDSETDSDDEESGFGEI